MIHKFIEPAHIYLLKEKIQNSRPLQAGLGILAFVLLFYGILKFRDVSTTSKTTVLRKSPDYQGGRVIDPSYKKIYRGKERALEGKVNVVLEKQLELLKKIEEQSSKINTLEGKIKEVKERKVVSPENRGSDQAVKSPESDIRLHSRSSDMRSQVVQNDSMVSKNENLRKAKASFLSNKRKLISFPVPSTKKSRKDEVSLPSGSYVKAKLLTGVEAPEGKTYPVLLQLDYAHILPNDKKLDLIGCFMIAKAQGDLSTERVQMQASKLSCVAKSGKMFEREINGFVADDADNSFAVIGKVNSKQGRVASMAFLSSVVEGVGKAIQMAQTNQQTNALGGSSSVISGDTGKYIAAGGVSNAASQVTRWYLKQAQSLLPTINVGSGQDVWVVLAEKVSLPNDYFNNKRSSKNESVYSYFTNILN